MSASSLFSLSLASPVSLTLLSSSSARYAHRPLSSVGSVSGSISPRKFSTFRAVAESKDDGMDAVQRRLMFEDECILVDETDRVVGHDSKYNSKVENKGVRNAAQRKLLDELGIVAEDVPVDEFIALGRLLYKAPSDGKWGEHELDHLLFIVRDVKVQPNPYEVGGIKYVSREELKELVKKVDAGEEGLKLSPWFRLVVDNFLMKWWDHVEKGTLGEIIDMETIHKL